MLSHGSPAGLRAANETGKSKGPCRFGINALGLVLSSWQWTTRGLERLPTAKPILPTERPVWPSLAAAPTRLG